MFTLAVSYLTTANLPWFMDPTFQVPMQYCSLASNLTFTIWHICNWASFLLWPSCLELLVIALSSFPVAYWTPSDLECSFSSVVFFVFSYCSWGSPVVCHFLLQWTTFCHNSSLWSCPSWVAQHGMAYINSLIALLKHLHHNIAMTHEGSLWNYLDPKN